MYFCRTVENTVADLQYILTKFMIHLQESPCRETDKPSPGEFL